MWIIGLLAIALVAAIVRHVRGHRHEFTIVAILVALGFVGYKEQHQRALVSTYESVASEIAGRPVKVHCQGFAGALVDVGAELGYVPWTEDGPADYTLIKRDACGSLASYIGGGKRRPSLDEVIAVHVLAHEAYHLAGIQSEARTECFSVQLNAHVAERLGASPGQAQRLAIAYWLRVYPDMPSGYTSSECRDGGKLDLHPNQEGWPTAGARSV